jgi:hypothetical protein
MSFYFESPAIMPDFLQRLSDFITAAGQSERTLAAAAFVVGALLVFYLLRDAPANMKFVAFVCWAVFCLTVLVVIAETYLPARALNLAGSESGGASRIGSATIKPGAPEQESETRPPQRAGPPAFRDSRVVQHVGRPRLSDVFAPSGYSSGSVIVGVDVRNLSAIDSTASKHLQTAIITALQERGISAEDFAPKVYEAGYFDKVLKGDVSLMDDTGLHSKLRATVFLTVAASCRKA